MNGNGRERVEIRTTKGSLGFNELLLEEVAETPDDLVRRPRHPEGTSECDLPDGYHARLSTVGNIWLRKTIKGTR